MTNLEDIKNLVARFSDETFGEDRQYDAVLYHLKKEVETGIVNGEIEDFVDMQCLLLDAFRKRFPNTPTESLLRLCIKKMEVLTESHRWEKIGQF